MSMSFDRVNILGVGVSAVNIDMTLEVIEAWINHRDPHYVCVTGVHGLIESHNDSKIRRIHNQAGLVTPDGMPLVWISRLMGYSHVERVYGPDLMLTLCNVSQLMGYKHFFYGGGYGIAEKLSSNLIDRFPALRIVGWYSPPFRDLTREEEHNIVNMIKLANPDILWVGLSTPKQELWMANYVDRLHVPVLIGVGAAFDFHAGLKKQAPRWMQLSGLEWLFRFFSEPRRLWRRYLFNNPLFLMLITLQLLGLRKSSINEYQNFS
jgi:N-acetylglucosaminyldiphosphoundecaprenol N-acetyl-beta-D-mannosaminyltransferase